MVSGKRRDRSPRRSTAKPRKRSRYDTASPPSDHDRFRKTPKISSPASSPSTEAVADRDLPNSPAHSVREVPLRMSPFSCDSSGQGHSKPRRKHDKKRSADKKVSKKKRKKDRDHKKRKRDRTTTSIPHSPDRSRSSSDESDEPEGSSRRGRETLHDRKPCGVDAVKGRNTRTGTQHEIVGEDGKEQHPEVKNAVGAPAAASIAPESAASPTREGGRGEEDRSGDDAAVDEDAPTPPASPERTSNEASAAITEGSGSQTRIRGISAADSLLDEDAPTPPPSPSKNSPADDPASERSETKQSEASTGALSTSKDNFFARLLDVERKKGRVGTVHASGPSATGSEVDAPKSSDWECLKCGKSNYKNASSCDRYTRLRSSRLTTKCSAWKTMLSIEAAIPGAPGRPWPSGMPSGSFCAVSCSSVSPWNIYPSFWRDE